MADRSPCRKTSRPARGDSMRRVPAAATAAAPQDLPPHSSAPDAPARLSPRGAER